jgi:hypothetical protein
MNSVYTRKAAVPRGALVRRRGHAIDNCSTKQWLEEWDESTVRATYSTTRKRSSLVISRLLVLACDSQSRAKRLPIAAHVVEDRRKPPIVRELWIERLEASPAISR